MKRGKPLERKTRLKANPETTRAWEQRSRDATLAREREEPRRAAPVAQARRAPRDEIPGPVWAAVYARAGGHCEAQLPGCSGRRLLAPHHRKRRAHGGPHTPENLVLLCGDCHTASPAAVHRNPTWAYGVGLLIRSSAPAPSEAWDAEELNQV